MRFDGRAYAETILEDLKPRVAQLTKKGIVPTLAAVLVGDNPSSLSFIKQKRIAAEKIGGVVTLDQLPADATDAEVNALITQLNADPAVHGIIIQRPLPSGSSVTHDTLLAVTPLKDIDGFVPNSPFAVPVALGVQKILENISSLSPKTYSPRFAVEAGPLNPTIVVIGRGETAGKPIADLLTAKGSTVTVIHSQTPHPETILKEADIIVSCVGKRRTVTSEMIKPGVILIGVGVTKDTDGKIYGDYEEADIAEMASIYTPTPGGVGPVNVACLMQNLVTAAKNSYTISI